MHGDRPPRRRLALVFVVLMLAGAATHARLQQPATFSAGNRTVAVFATVTDATGRISPVSRMRAKRRRSLEGWRPSSVHWPIHRPNPRWARSLRRQSVEAVKAVKPRKR